MRICRYLSLLAIAALIATASARAAGLADLLANHDGADSFNLISIQQLAKLMANQDLKLAVFDANLPETREHWGVIKGARLLPSSDKYDVAAELPADKDTKLVFYCANTH